PNVKGFQMRLPWVWGIAPRVLILNLNKKLHFSLLNFLLTLFKFKNKVKSLNMEIFLFKIKIKTL
ncbi:MAG TPA: hypothetical protein DCS88_01225, partial [Alphaproteobacteria bacterium]|nr:hypothetical protein [Alphaproteobacteria bacterium]